jgi:hypothetical protein
MGRDPEWRQLSTLPHQCHSEVTTRRESVKRARDSLSGFLGSNIGVVTIMTSYNNLTFSFLLCKISKVQNFFHVISKAYS